MSDLWLGDVGICVTNLERSLRFYKEVLGLEEIARGGDDESSYVLLKDRRSGQRLELNWYAESSPFHAPYVAGEALDHFEIRVRSVPDAVERLRAHGIEPATQKLWVNQEAIQRMQSDPAARGNPKKDVWTLRSGHRVVYIQDPDGIFLCLYDHPEENWDDPIPDHY